MKSRLEFKVGLFVLIGLVLLAILMIQFSKGMSMFRSSYRINLQSEDAGGLREQAGVLMAGVQIGSVEKVELARDGRSVTIVLKIYSDFKVYKDALFIIEQSGFLGDQYVAIQPTKNQGGVFEDGARAQTEPAFNLQQAARSASGLIQRLDLTAKQLGDAVTDIHRLLLNPENLTNLAATVTNLRDVSHRALGAVDKVENLIAENSPALSQSSSNLVVFSEHLRGAGSSLTNLIAENSPQVTAAVSNLESSAEVLRGLLVDVQHGKGPAGKILRDEEVAADISNLARNLSITSSNLNRLGLWGILWKRKVPKEEATAPAEQLRSPKQSSR